MRFHVYRDGRGSLEHYWHYFFGFMLPFLNLYRTKPDLLHSAQLFIPSCGPAMDSLALGVGNSLSLDIAIGQGLAVSRTSRFKMLRVVQRICRRINGIPKWPSIESVRRGNDIYLLSWEAYLRKGTIPDASFAAELIRTVDHVVKLAERRGCCQNETPTNAYLLLRRSQQHPHYSDSGGAEIKGYGTGRRTLLGIEKCKLELGQRKINARIYEPGAHDLFCQARHFSRAQGIVGVRGAEFANMVWMKPHALVVLINSRDFDRDPNMQRKLASVIRLDGYQEMSLDDAVSPTVEPDSIAVLISEHERKTNQAKSCPSGVT